MKNSSENDLGPVCLNNELFVINGAPLKFYLHGYNESKSSGMIRIIEAYGGKSSKPDAPDTFVFCEPNCCYNGEHDFYNIGYFHDSIAALEPPELKNYKLHSRSNEQPWRFTNYQEWFSLEDNEVNNVKHEKSRKYRLTVTVDRRLTSPVDDDELTESYCNGEKSDNDQENDIDDSSSPECEDEQTESDDLLTAKKPDVNPSKTESFVDVDHLNESENRNMSEEEQINHQDNDNSMDVEENRGESTSEVEEHSEESNDESVASSHLSSFETERKKRRRKMIFTEEMDQKMMTWVMQKNIVPSDFGVAIWRDMLKEKVLGDCSVSPKVLSLHYRKILKSNLKFKKYIEDLKRGNRDSFDTYNHRWTALEDRILMNYIIDNDLICDTTNRLKCGKIWLDCFMANKLSLHPKRTDLALRKRFNQYLRYNYSKFTNKAKVLKKFKELNKREQKNVR